MSDVVVDVQANYYVRKVIWNGGKLVYMENASGVVPAGKFINYLFS